MTDAPPYILEVEESEGSEIWHPLTWLHGQGELLNEQLMDNPPTWEATQAEASLISRLTGRNIMARRNVAGRGLNIMYSGGGETWMNAEEWYD